MASRQFLITIFVILVSFSACYARFLSDVTSSNGINVKNHLMSRNYDFKRSLREDTHESSDPRIFSVDDFGAKGNGKDDTNAFNRAWEEACSSKTSATFVVPKNTYLVKPIRFKGPCKSDSIMVRILGTIEASEDRSDYPDRHWLVFDRIEHLTVEGGGTINGNGNVWWKNSCKINKSLPCKEAPTALTFHGCENLIARNFNVRDAQQIQVVFDRCNNVTASHLNVTAPGHSPNTDGIHVTHTTNIHISNCIIGTGDDCISIVSGSKTVRATDITCGPGHGISIGSLGAKNEEAHVSDVIVNRAKLSETTNGLRIKTWQGGSGSASNIKFMNVEMNNVKNPIIIDQNYCDQKKPCNEKSSAVQVSDVLYHNITGTSSSNIAIKFDCSKSFRCEKIVLQDVHIQQYGDKNEKASKALCDNVELRDVGVVTPMCPNGNNSEPPSTQQPPKASPSTPQPPKASPSTPPPNSDGHHHNHRHSRHHHHHRGHHHDHNDQVSV